MFEHRIQDNQQFPHARRQGDLLCLANRTKLPIHILSGTTTLSGSERPLRDHPNDDEGIGYFMSQMETASGPLTCEDLSLEVEWDDLGQLKGNYIGILCGGGLTVMYPRNISTSSCTVKDPFFTVV